MANDWMKSVYLELGAAFNMLETAINHATEEMWNHPNDEMPFWRRAFHTVFYCNLYFSDFDPDVDNAAEEFRLPDYLKEYHEAQWTEKDFFTPASKEAILRFLEETRSALRDRFDKGIVSEEVGKDASFYWLPMTKGTLLLYNMRHIMEHVAHLNDTLRAHGLEASEWQSLQPL